jgi:protein-S-isoprenylcysteine O-methyltransferase Ste14
MIRKLVGSGDKIGLLVLPFLVGGVILNLVNPRLFEVGGPPWLLRAISIVVLIPGIVIWAWSAILILTSVPRDELITGGPFALVKHPPYTSVALMVLPWAGFLLNRWLGVVLGAVLYIGVRMFAPEEEAELSRGFGSRWDQYRCTVRTPWA